MKKLVSILIVAACITGVYLQYAQQGARLGFSELKFHAVLIDDQQYKVECDYYAYGWFDAIRLENRYRECVNGYKDAGYTVLSEDRVADL